MSTKDVITWVLLAVFVGYMMWSTRKIDKRYDDPTERERQRSNSERQLRAAERQSEALESIADSLRVTRLK